MAEKVIDVAKQTTAEELLNTVENSVNGVSYSRTIAGASPSEKSAAVKIEGKGQLWFLALSSYTFYFNVDGASSYKSFSLLKNSLRIHFNESIEFYGYGNYIAQLV